jgi:hypothetical protein
MVLTPDVGERLLSLGEDGAQADDAWLEQHRDALVDAIAGRS